MKITAELRAQARMIADAPEGAELQESNDNGQTWRNVSGGVVVFGADYAYRLKPEPRTIYVNEYDEGFPSVVHDSKDGAVKDASPYAKRIAVEYREVVK